MDSFSAYFNYLLINLFVILVANTLQHDGIWHKAAPVGFFLSKKSWVKGGTECSLLCPLLSFSLCSSSTETSEREKDECALPLRLGNVCVCVGRLWIWVCVWAECVTCSNRVSAPMWSHSDSFEEPILCNTFLFISVIMSELVSLALCAFGSGSNDRWGERPGNLSTFIRLLPITPVIEWTFSCMHSTVKHRLTEEGDRWIIAINPDLSSEREDQSWRGSSGLCSS